MVKERHQQFRNEEKAKGEDLYVEGGKEEH